MPNLPPDLPEVELDPAPVTYDDYISFTPEKLEIVDGHLIEGPGSTEQRGKLLALLLKNLGLVEVVRLLPEEKWSRPCKNSINFPRSCNEQPGIEEYGTSE